MSKDIVHGLLVNYKRAGVDVLMIWGLPGEILVPGTFKSESDSTEDADDLRYRKWNLVDTIRLILEEGRLVGSDVETQNSQPL